MSEQIKPCPFCGVKPDVIKHFKHDIWSLMHRCKLVGPISIDWCDDINGISRRWNRRASDTPSGVERKEGE